ncbi:hypothetical protein EG327_005795 [Venturia inaequalis]|uniref:nicotinamidase n=1 Tax=Venturia inaequalis TaxID=5025 RepID=A0A8H3Z2B2_VENIN|nr:hypothetical protein EG327_005795 [Venturia inaequalis]
MAYKPALVVVDFQDDFCPPTGSLAVTDGRAIAPTVNALLSLPFILKIATKDWHPRDHISFASNHPPPNNTPFTSVITIKNPLNPLEEQTTRLWPDHCIQDTKGAELVPEMDQSKIDVVIKKGMDKRVEMYSAFADPFLEPSVSKSRLEAILKEKGITHVFCVGLAMDYCVKATALDAAKAGFKTYVVSEGTKAVDASAWSAVEADLKREGVQMIGLDSTEVDEFEFRVCPAFREKPQPKEETSEEPVKMMGEGSDLQDDPTIEITRINGTHILLYNKFCISKSQLMIVTANSYHRQYDPLDGDDLEAARIVLCSLTSPHFIFFNGGVTAGASRKHKHLQVLRTPKDSTNLLVNKHTTKEFPKLPYKYFSVDFADQAQPSKELLLKTYQNLLGRCEGLVSGKQGESVPHDVILTKHWMVVIPRSKRNFEGSSDVNAAGMVGMIWLKHDEEVDKWKELGPARVLRQLGVSNGNETG